MKVDLEKMQVTDPVGLVLQFTWDEEVGAYDSIATSIPEGLTEVDAYRLLREASEAFR